MNQRHTFVVGHYCSRVGCGSGCSGSYCYCCSCFRSCCCCCSCGCCRGSWVGSCCRGSSGCTSDGGRCCCSGRKGVVAAAVGGSSSAVAGSCSGSCFVGSGCSVNDKTRKRIHREFSQKTVTVYSR